MSVDTNEMTFGFEHVHLNEVDPTFDVVPDDVYQLKFLKGEVLDFEYKPGNKKGIPAGTVGQRIKLSLMITNNDQFAGRRIWATLFPSNFTLKVLRRLSDRVGIPQEAGEDLPAWLERMSEIQPEFRTKVEASKDREGKVVLNDYGKPAENAVDWRTLLPAE